MKCDVKAKLARSCGGARQLWFLPLLWMLGCQPADPSSKDVVTTPDPIEQIEDLGGDVTDSVQWRNSLRTIALVGDLGAGNDTRRVLARAVQEGAEAVILLGDLDYEDNPAKWGALFDDEVPPETTMLLAAGNHDELAWQGYAEWARRRQVNDSTLECHGELGVQQSCAWRGIRILISGIGVFGENHAEFIESELKNATERWKICAWHKVRRDFQVGEKSGTDVDWRAYQSCLAHGAIIAQAHEHSYSRTRTLTAIGDTDRGHGAVGPSDRVELGPWKSFLFVSGLGGRSIRDYHAELHADSTWWATIFTSNYYMKNGVEVSEFTPEFGVSMLALPIAQGESSDENTPGLGYFIGASGRVLDSYEIVRAEAR